MSDTVTLNPLAVAARDRGIAALDTYFTDHGTDTPWRDRIDPTLLDMSSPWQCVLGQVFEGEAIDAWTSGYVQGIVVLGLSDADSVVDFDEADAAELGFERSADFTRTELAAAWRAVLGGAA